uniref:NADH dehydrogenase subunit 4 n=1 Tax=Miroplana shenzhensis TaxID=2597322 RepID=UPI001FAE8A0D|nr:NADH dehydrogenase subunit 4 [Miroplana shenzhensis]UJT52301.1 NADH dehydrogenase subunit 4 [Miroplana shenzhensis]
MEFFMGLLSIIFFMFYSISNIISFLFFFECSYLILLILLMNYGSNPERMGAIIYLLIYSSIGASGYLMVASSYEVGANHSSNFLHSVFQTTCGFDSPLEYWEADDYYMNIVNETWLGFPYLVFLVFPFLVKLPVFGLHSWLPKAHVEAPLLGSMVLAGVLLKLGFFGLVRFNLSNFRVFNYSSGLYLFELFSLFFLFGLVIINFVCSRQFDLKSFIAYSSVVHMSLISVSFLTNTNLWVYGGSLLSFSHAFCSSAMFLIASIFYDYSSTRNMQLNRGYFFFFPLVVFFWFVFCIFNSSFPLSVNFLSELILMSNGVFFFNFSFWVFMFNVFFTGLYSMILYMVCSSGSNNLSIYWVENLSLELNCLNLFYHFFYIFVGFFFISSLIV